MRMIILYFFLSFFIYLFTFVLNVLLLSSFPRERMLQSKNNRKLEKRLKELLLQLEDERRHADQYKEQVEKSTNRVKVNRARQFILFNAVLRDMELT